MSTAMRFSYTIVAREVWPLAAGDLARYAHATAALLAAVAEVLVVTADSEQQEYERLRQAGDPRLPAARFAFIAAGDRAEDFGAAVEAQLEGLHPDGGPDILEFADRGGDGAASLRARRDGNPTLRRTQVCVRLHGTAELHRALNGVAPDPEARRIDTQERDSLVLADWVLYAGGDVLGTYQRFYGGARLPAARRIAHARLRPGAARPERRRRGDGLHLLHLGPLEPRLGVQELVEAARALPGEGWTLTIAGPDTATGPEGSSMRARLATLAGGDPRIRFVGGASAARLDELLASHDVIVSAARWDAWPWAAAEALARDRPALATPTGAAVELLAAEPTWLLPGTAVAALRGVLEAVIRDRDRVEQAIASGIPRSILERTSPDDAVIGAYEALAWEPRPRLFGRRRRAIPIGGSAPERLRWTVPPWAVEPRPGRTRGAGSGTDAGGPLTSVLVAAYEAEGTLPEAVLSTLGQTVERIEVVVVDDGSSVPVVDVLADVRDPRLRIVRHGRNRGLSRALNTALAAARAPLVSELDADDAWEPRYVESILPCFEDPAVGLAYANAAVIGGPEGVTARIMDPSVHPLDHFPKLAEQNPIPSPTVTARTSAVRQVGGWATWLPRAMDYHLYLKLAHAGWRFAYVHRELARYRWPEPERGMSHDRRAMERSELRMWLAFAVRHPLTPGPRRQLRSRLMRELREHLPARQR